MGLKTASRHPPPIARYGCLRFLVDQGVGNIKGPTHDLAFDRISYMSKHGTNNQLSMKRLVKSFDAPMGPHPAATTYFSRGRGKLIIFGILEWTAGF